MPTNRELVEVLLLLALIAVASLSAKVRQAIRGVWAAFWRPKVVGPLVLLVFICGGTVLGASSVGLWSTELLGQACLWFFWSGWTLFLSATDVFKKQDYFRKRLRSILSSSIIIGAFFGLVSFRFWIEVLFIAAAVVIQSLIAVGSHQATKDQAYVLTVRVLQGCLTAIVGAVTLVTLVRLITTLDKVDWEWVWKSMAMAIWLPLVALLTVVLFGVCAEYGWAFTSMRIANGFEQPPFHARLAVLLGFNRHVQELRRFMGGRTRAVTQAGSLLGSFCAVREFRRHLVQERRDELAHESRCRDFAGVQALDSDGKRLDQREFDETRDALHRLTCAHMGWYRREQRYRTELLTIIGDFSLQGLPGEHNIEMRVRDDGQAWYAWRRTVTGWVFAIGAAKAPPDEWRYDGPEPPSGFPGEDPTWGNRPFDIPENWG